MDFEQKKILIVVDVQNGFTKKHNTAEIANKIKNLTNSGIFDVIIATKFINSEDSLFSNYMQWKEMTSMPDIGIVEGIKYDHLIEKNLYTCVNKKFLNFLKDINNNQNPKEIYLCGIDTDCCVLKTATDLFENNIIPKVLTDYCASSGGEKSHQAGITAMRRLIGEKSLIQFDLNNN